MGETNFYKLLGVGRSASADQIKVAYRELVKKHHPDLFTAVSEKAKATEKLRLINEAYGVLGNAERRQRYDQEFAQTQRTRPHAPAAAARRKAPRARRRQAEVRRKTLKIPKLRLGFSKKWAGYSLAAAAAILLLIYAGRSVPRLVTAWVLMEKLEISPPRNISPPVRADEGWVRVAQFASVSNCATAIKEKVRQDEQEGSRAVYDEQNGTMAITVYVKKENAEALEDVNLNAERERAAAVEDASKNEQRQLERHATAESTDSLSKSGMTRRVRSLECRVTQRLETESRLRRALQKIGLFA